MTNVDSETFPAWNNFTNYGRSYGTEGETNCSARFERKSIPENETVFILKTVDKEELISEIKGSSSSSWSGALTATIIGNAIFIKLRKILYLIHLTSPFSSHCVPLVFAKILKKPHPKMSQFLTVTSTIFMVVASFCFERVFGRNVNRPAPAIPEDGGQPLPIAQEVRLAIEEM